MTEFEWWPRWTLRTFLQVSTLVNRHFIGLLVKCSSNVKIFSSVNKILRCLVFVHRQTSKLHNFFLDFLKRAVRRRFFLFCESTRFEVFTDHYFQRFSWQLYLQTRKFLLSDMISSDRALTAIKTDFVWTKIGRLKQTLFYFCILLSTASSSEF